MCALTAGAANSRCATLDFAGRTWTIKQSNSPVGPGGNRFSASPDDIWVDSAGLHLTIHNHGGLWYSTEVILNGNLGYGTYAFQTSSRQDILNANATFGAFTWDTTGTSPIPGDPNREIDFEDSRWGNPSSSTNSQIVVQPYYVSGNLQRFTLPDLSEDAALTRFFTWSPGQVEFFSLAGHYLPTDFPGEAVFHHYLYLDNGVNHRVPEPGQENFRFNLWLNEPAPVGNQPVEVVIKDFVFVPLVAGDYDGSGTVGPEDYGVWSADFGRQVVRFSGADGNGDGQVGAADFVVWRKHLSGAGGGDSVPVATVPEPGAAVLFVWGTCAIVLWRRGHFEFFLRSAGSGAA